MERVRLVRFLHYNGVQHGMERFRSYVKFCGSYRLFLLCKQERDNI